MTDRNGLRVIVEPDEDGFVAQCIDYDILGIGPTPDDAIQEFVRAFIRHVLVAVERHEAPLSSVPPPLQEYRDRWELSIGSGALKPKAFEIPRFRIQKAARFDFSEIPHQVSALVPQCA